MSQNDYTYSTFANRLSHSIPDFEQEYAELIHTACELPHVIMMHFVEFVVRSFRQRRDDHGRLIESALEVLERGLTSRDEKLNELIRVSFVEHLFDMAPEVFRSIPLIVGSQLEFEFMARNTQNIGYTVAHVINNVFSDRPPDTLSAMLANDEFVERLSGEGVLAKEQDILDAWGHPFHYEMRTLADSGARVHCVISLGLLRGIGRDIVSCEPVTVHADQRFGR